MFEIAKLALHCQNVITNAAGEETGPRFGDKREAKTASDAEPTTCRLTQSPDYVIVSSAAAVKRELCSSFKLSDRKIMRNGTWYRALDRFSHHLLALTVGLNATRFWHGVM